MNNTEEEIWDIMDDLKEEEYVKENGERDTSIICSCGCNEFIVEDLNDKTQCLAIPQKGTTYTISANKGCRNVLSSTSSAKTLLMGLGGFAASVMVLFF